MSGAHPTRVAAYGTGLLRTEIHALPAPGAGPVAAPGAGSTGPAYRDRSRRSASSRWRMNWSRSWGS